MIQAAEEAKQIAETENEQHRTAQRIRANIDKMRKRLEVESMRLDDALQTDMQKRHDEIRIWCSELLAHHPLCFLLFTPYRHNVRHV